MRVDFCRTSCRSLCIIRTPRLLCLFAGGRHVNHDNRRMTNKEERMHQVRPIPAHFRRVWVFVSVHTCACACVCPVAIVPCCTPYPPHWVYWSLVHGFSS